MASEKTLLRESWTNGSRSFSSVIFCMSQTLEDGKMGSHRGFAFVQYAEAGLGMGMPWGARRSPEKLRLRQRKRPLQA